VKKSVHIEPTRAPQRWLCVDGFAHAALEVRRRLEAPAWVPLDDRERRQPGRHRQ
jgi:hypothetical protein